MHAIRFLTALIVLLPLARVAYAQNDEVPPSPTIDLEAWPNRRMNVILPPAWAFGVLYGGYTNQEESLAKVDRIIESGFPIDAYWIDSWFWDYENGGDGPDGYIDFVGDREHYPDPAAMWQSMRDRGLKSGIWVWDRILQDGNEEVWSDFDSRGYLTRHWTMTVTWHTDGKSKAAFVDFANPKAAYYWQRRLKPFFDMGLDFLKIDAAATVPYMEAAFEATKRYGLETEGRGFILSHGNTPGGIPPEGGPPELYSYPAKWTGDAAIRWTQPNYPDLRSYQLGGLAEQVRIFTSRTDKGHYPFLGVDTGGFSHGSPSDELFTRWAQFSAFTPIMQVFGNYDKMESNSPYLYGEAAQESFRFHTRLRMRLFPYIYSYAHLSRLTEHNIIRPMKHRRDQYFFGDALIVAPVYEPGVDSRYVKFPEGVWHDFWSGETFDQGSLGTTRNVDVRPDRVPLFVRRGAIVPMRPYARSSEAGSNDVIDLHVWPGKRSTFHLIEDDGTSNDYERGRLARTDIQLLEGENGGFQLRVLPVEGGYDGMPESRTFRVHVRAFDMLGWESSADESEEIEDDDTQYTVVEIPFDVREGFIFSGQPR